MKKTIALFLAAALLGVGLIASCSDDPEPAKEPAAPVEKFTVAFDANGGELAKGTKIVVTVEKGKTIGTTNWPADPVKTTVFDYGEVEDDFNGWYDGTKKYSATEPITKDVTLVASYSPFVRPERETEYVTALGGFTWVNGLTQQGWRSENYSDDKTELPWADIAEARYLVLHSKGGDKTDQFGDIQLVIQSDGNGGGWEQTNINGFYYDRKVTDDIYFAIDITTLKTYTKFVKGTEGRFLIAYYGGKSNATGLGLQEAYLTNKDLKKDKSVTFSGNDSSTDASVTSKKRSIGFVTKENILDLTAPTPADLFTVTFAMNGADTAIDPINVLKNKGIGVRFPLDPEDFNYVFLGWFDGTVTPRASADKNTAPTAAWGTKYDGLTKVTKNTTLTAGWQLEPALDKIPIKVGSDSKDIAYTGIVADSPFKVKIIEGPILVVSAGNWNWALVKIPIDLGTKKLSDVKKVSFKLTGIKGGNSDATSSKNYLLLARKALADFTPNNPYVPANHAIAAQVSTGNVANGTELPMEFTIDQAKVTSLGLTNESTFYISIWASMQAACQIKDIVFELN